MLFGNLLPIAETSPCNYSPMPRLSSNLNLPSQSFSKPKSLALSFGGVLKYVCCSSEYFSSGGITSLKLLSCQLLFNFSNSSMMGSSVFKILTGSDCGNDGHRSFLKKRAPRNANHPPNFGCMLIPKIFCRDKSEKYTSSKVKMNNTITSNTHML